MQELAYLGDRPVPVDKRTESLRRDERPVRVGPVAHLDVGNSIDIAGHRVAHCHQLIVFEM